MEFSAQLQRLWETTPTLQLTMGENAFAPAILEKRRIKLEQPHLGKKYAHSRISAFGFEILPLITCFSGLICELTIEFLRRDQPGGIFNSGDIDNRLKTLLDALRMPQSAQEMPTNLHGSGGTYLYCLMEDDSLVTKVTIDTQELLTSCPVTEPDDYAELLIKISIEARRPHVATKDY